MNRDIPMGVLAGWVLAILLISSVLAGLLIAVIGFDTLNNPDKFFSYSQEMPAKEATEADLDPELVQTVELPNGKFMYVVKQK